MKKIWKKYKGILEKVGAFNLIWILGLVYLIIIPILKIFLMFEKKESGWIKKEIDYPNSHEHQF